MERSDFFALPPAIAIRVLFDCLGPSVLDAIEKKEKPVEPRTPKFDRAIYRKEGVMWASETSFEGLVYWHKRAAGSAASGSAYAEKDKKQAEELQRWIAWREWYPEAIWSGERNREAVVAKPPSAKPAVYPRSGDNRPPPPPPDDLVNSDDTIPF